MRRSLLIIYTVEIVWKTRCKHDFQYYVTLNLEMIVYNYIGKFIASSSCKYVVSVNFTGTLNAMPRMELEGNTDCLQPPSMHRAWFWDYAYT